LGHEQSYSPPSSFFQITERDILAELLADKRSENTRRAYARDLKDFFQSAAGHEPTPQLIAEFLKLERFTAIALVLQYKAALIEKGLTEATVNRRLASIKSLVKYAQKIGRCDWSLEEVEGERVSQYRDTSGIDQDAYARLLATCDRSTRLGKRNYALLLLLWSNVLRRGEVVKCNCSDFNPELRTLQILGKGRGTQAEAVSLSTATVEAIAIWLEARGTHQPAEPLFISLSNSSYGHRLSGNALYNLVTEAAIAAGISKHMSPHRTRHSGITAALDATGGDVRRVQKLSRHRRLDTLMIYDDQRKNAQGEITDLLSGLVDSAGDGSARVNPGPG
jgi:integrase/recombinase XerC